MLFGYSLGKSQELLCGLAAAGLPGYESVLMVGLFTTAGTPAAVIDRLNRETLRALARPDVKEKFYSVGVEPVGRSNTLPLGVNT